MKEFGSSRDVQDQNIVCTRSFWQIDRQPSKAVALVGPDGFSLSYADLKNAADEAVERFPNRERDVAFILFENHPSAVAVYLGALRRRSTVPLLLHTNINPTLLDALIETYAPAWIAGRRGTQLPGDYRPHSDFDGYILYARAAAPSGPSPHPDCAVLLSTSGSTGSPKLVRLSYSGLAHNASSIAQYLGLAPDDRAITTLPLAYSFGMSILNSHLAAGGSLRLTNDGLLTREFWKTASASSITSLSGVPSTYAMLRRAEIQKRGLCRLRALCQAGGRLSDEDTRHFLALARDHGWSFFVMYGQTEASPRISYVPPERLADKVGSIGVPIPGGSLEVDRTTGELVYRGPNVMMGYALTRDDLARPDECSGELRTGDLGRRDEDGFFYLTGRLKRFLKFSGNRINLDEVEVALAKVYGVMVACVGRDDELSVVLPSQGAPEDGEVRRLIRDLFNIYGGTVRIRRVASFPQLGNGKIDYAALNA
jgi:acyl-CoA synthetase (AMP-forming)/AMP-acid ligase II